MLWMFNPITYSYLRFDIVDYAAEPQTAETARRQSSSSSLNGNSQNKTLCEVEQPRIYKCIEFHFTSYVQHTLHYLAGYLLFPSPPPTIFSSLCILKSPESLPGGSCLGPLGVVCFSGNWSSSELDLLRFWTSATCAGSSCTLLFCLYLVSLTQKIHWREHSLADTVPLFSTILQFSSELSNNWGTGLPCLRPSLIYCTGQQHKATLFTFLFSCLSFLCLQLLHHGSYLSFAQVFLSFHTCTITSPFLWKADCPFFKHLPSSSRSRGMPLLALIVPLTVTFLSSNVSANFTLL